MPFFAELKCQFYIFGEYTPCEKIAAEIVPVTMIVKIQETKILPKIFQLISLRFLSHKLIPTTAPVMHCVEEMGKPYLEAKDTTSAVASSAANPRDGEI